MDTEPANKPFHQLLIFWPNSETQFVDFCSPVIVDACIGVEIIGTLHMLAAGREPSPWAKCIMSLPIRPTSATLTVDERVMVPFLCEISPMFHPERFSPAILTNPVLSL